MDKVVRNVVSSVVAIVVITLVFGFAFPALMTGFSQLAFDHEANGSLITKNGKVVGSELAAQGFTKPQYFHERPSATAPPYNADGTTFSNLGPTSSGAPEAGAGRDRRDSQARGAVQPGPDRPRHPRRRRHHLRLRDRPRHHARVRSSSSRVASPRSGTWASTR